MARQQQWHELNFSGGHRRSFGPYVTKKTIGHKSSNYAKTEKLPSWNLAVVHVRRHNHPRLAPVPLSRHRTKSNMKREPFQLAKVREGCVGSSSAHPTVQNHHVTGVRGQPRLHRFTNGADSVQGRSMKVRPAVVLHLKHSRGNVYIFAFSPL